MISRTEFYRMKAEHVQVEGEYGPCMSPACSGTSNWPCDAARLILAVETDDMPMLWRCINDEQGRRYVAPGGQILAQVTADE